MMKQEKLVISGRTDSGCRQRLSGNMLAEPGQQLHTTSETMESDLALAGWYGLHFGSTTHTVGGKLPNAWGIYDMQGNVWEWCNDWKDSYSSGNATNPKGAQTGFSRVLRGGSWGGNADYCRSAYRGSHSPDERLHNIGFRVFRCAQ